MAASIAPDRPSLVIGNGQNGHDYNLDHDHDDSSIIVDDPFITKPTGARRLRYSTFDSDAFSLGPGSSPTSAKRVLEAHLSDTERRMQEAGKLGTALVQQREELTERLREVEQLAAESELSPELKLKLASIEQEYNEVAKESARAFLPKPRVPSSEGPPGSPFVGEISGRRSVSPSKFESMATGSPTKLSVPNRRSRNQPTNRIHDIEFAAEISTSLITQVRNLQSLLQEREEELKDVKSDRNKLEADAEQLQQRVRTLDESEHRYKDENWNLETQLHELTSTHKDATDREKKLGQTLAILHTDKTSTQRELDEVKVNHAKLSEDHAAAIKHHDIELGTAKRTAAIAESERQALQRKIDDLTGQNHELARAITTQRGRGMDRDDMTGPSEDDFESAADNITPEHSPPPSPVKATPRHSGLESETLKSSLQHAQRTIQSLRNNVHREKTEKLEMKRMLQEARDELEKNRDPHGASKRAKKVESRDFKKTGKLSQLGILRSSRSEILQDDPEWEEDDGGTPTTTRFPKSATSPRMPGIYPSTDNAETDTGTDGFETARERETETDDFQTGAEDLSDDGAATETETPTNRNRLSRPPILLANSPMNRYSFQSTASDDDQYDPRSSIGDFSTRTPTAVNPHNMRLQGSRSGVSRRTRELSEEPTLQSSPISAGNSSFSGTPQQAGQSLFAELGDFGGSDDESLGPATPSRRSVRSATPAAGTGKHRTSSPTPAVPALPKVMMIDSGSMTDPVNFEPAFVAGERPMSLQSVDSVIRPGSQSWLDVPTRSGIRPDSYQSYSDASVQHDPEMNMNDRLAQFPSPPKAGVIEETPAPHMPRLSMSTIYSEGTEPRVEREPEPHAPTPRAILGMSRINSEHVAPRVPDEVIAAKPPAFSFSNLIAEHTQPVSVPEPEPRIVYLPAPVPEKVPEPEPRIVYLPAPVPEKVLEPERPAQPEHRFSRIISEHTQPVSAPEPEPRIVYLPAPVAEKVPEPARPAPPEHKFSTIVAAQVEPRAEPVVPSPRFSLSSVDAQHVEPRAEPAADQPRFSMSSVDAQHVKPEAAPAAVQPSLTLSSVDAQHVEPREDPKQDDTTESSKLHLAEAAALCLSTIHAIDTRPETPKSPKRNGFIIPRDSEQHVPDTTESTSRPQTPKKGLIGSVLGAFGRSKDAAAATPVIAEDETRQSGNTTPLLAETPESHRPLKEVTGNANAKPIARQPLTTLDSAAQTSLTSQAIDDMLKAKHAPILFGGHHQRSDSVNSTGTTRRRGSQSSVNSVVHNNKSNKGKEVAVAEAMMVEAAPLRRPGSVSSARGSIQDRPPLPPNHKEVIQAAKTSAPPGSSMGPPLFPASAYKNPIARPRTPQTMSMSPSQNSDRGTPTPRPNRTESAHGTAEIYSLGRMTGKSRQSSMSSFVSEVDARFNNAHPGMAMSANGFGPNTDPRMIQAITQTMIGEYLWKYTRKAGRGEMSEKRHRRYFWVHPYTKTLYWSDYDPQTAGRAELKAKSVPIEAVRIVSDDNPMPPGLHRKSLVVIAPGRTVKFTCTTGQRHETWFNALSYLLLRSETDQQTDTREMAGDFTREDVDEFNPGYGGGGGGGGGNNGGGGGSRRPASSNTHRRPPVSLSSYNSRATRTGDSPAAPRYTGIPTLTPSRKSTGGVGGGGMNSTTNAVGANTPRGSVGSRLSGYMKSASGRTFGSLRGRNSEYARASTIQEQASIYEASEVPDSAEDLRVLYERQDREAEGMDNVRACCDGKHDVGTLHRRGGGGGHGHADHSHSNSQASQEKENTRPGQSVASTPSGTARSRVG